MVKKRRGKIVERKCKRCGKTFQALLIKVRQGGGIFCSKNCYQQYRREHKKEEKYLNCIYQKKNKYGLLKEEYEKLLKETKNICCICGNFFSEKNKPCVDHNHETKKVRGIICSKCNTLIGFANEDIKILQNAIKYLKRHKEG